MQKLAILGWLLLGAILGWAVAVHLWQAKCLNPYSDYPLMLLIVVGCMVLTATYGARAHRELLPRLIAYPLFFAGLAWIMRPTSCGTGQAYWLARQVAVVTILYPVLIIPAGVLGGILAITFTKLRSKDEIANPVSTVSPEGSDGLRK